MNSSQLLGGEDDCDVTTQPMRPQTAPHIPPSLECVVISLTALYPHCSSAPLPRKALTPPPSAVFDDTFTERRRLNAYLEASNGSAQHECGQCKQRFANADQLRVHANVHRLEDSRR